MYFLHFPTNIRDPNLDQEYLLWRLLLEKMLSRLFTLTRARSLQDLSGIRSKRLSLKIVCSLVLVTSCVVLHLFLSHAYDLSRYSLLYHTTTSR